MNNKIRGVRVEDDKVIVMAKGGNEGARQLCGELLEPSSMRVLGYVRKEMLDMCQRGGNAAALTLVPVAPKSGAWVAVYVEGK